MILTSVKREQYVFPAYIPEASDLQKVSLSKLLIITDVLPGLNVLSSLELVVV